MTSDELKIADQLLSHQLDLLRLGAFAQDQAVALLNQMGLELERDLRNANLTEFNRARLTSLLNQTTEVIDRYFTLLNSASSNAATGSAQLQGKVSSRILAGVSLDASIPSTTFITSILSKSLIEGAKSAEWWKRQAGDIKFRFAAAVRSGLARGETQEQIVKRVVGSATQPGIMNIARANARILVHSSIQQAANDARLASFRENSDIIEGVRQLSTLDSHTTVICIAYADGSWDLDGKPLGRTTLPFNGGPPRHWGCRSVLVPITKTFRSLGMDIPEFPRGPRASAEGPVNMTMKKWIDSRTREQLDEQLGEGRAQLYRSGKISLQQLLDLRGNPLTLKQLERKYH